MKNKSIAMAIVFEILLKTVNISGHNIFMKIKYLSFSIGSYSEVYLATVCDWRAGGDLSAPVPTYWPGDHHYILIHIKF